MGLPVVTVVAGGLPVVESTVGGTPVTEAANGYGVPVTKVVGKPGLPVVFETIGAGGGAGTINSPLDLTGLVGWWDARVFASFNLTGAQINSVADQSGNASNLAFAGFGKPTYNATGFNSQPSMMFDTAVGSALMNSAFPMGAGNTLTAFYVGTAGSATSNADARILAYRGLGAGSDWNNAGSWLLYRLNATTLQVTRNSVTSGPAAITAHPAGHRVIMTCTSAGLITVYVDGVSAVTVSSAGNWLTGGHLSIGRQVTTNSQYITAPIGEAGVATGFHTATQVGQLDTYLKNKWGL